MQKLHNNFSHFSIDSFAMSVEDKIQSASLSKRKCSQYAFGSSPCRRITDHKITEMSGFHLAFQCLRWDSIDMGSLVTKLGGFILVEC